jgi:cyclase
MSAKAWLKLLTSMPIGELYLNLIDQDGTGQGYMSDLLNEMQENSSFPVIFADGVGNYHHLLDGIRGKKLDAVATAHLFNFVGNGLSDARENLLNENVVLPVWDKNIIIELRKNVANN